MIGDGAVRAGVLGLETLLSVFGLIFALACSLVV
jgi:hypothetical protein